MNRKVRKTIPFLRKQGMGYGEIANKLNIKKDYVKKFCKLHRIGGFPLEYHLNVSEAQKRGEACLYCGMPLKQPRVGRKRMYCDSTCRKRNKDTKNDEDILSHETTKSPRVATSPRAFSIDDFACDESHLEALYQKSPVSRKEG